MRFRPTVIEVDQDALVHNVSLLKSLAEPALTCVAVKANGYGHGMVSAAQAALKGGATWLAVALVEEAIELREHGIDSEILVLSQPSGPGIVAASKHNVVVTIDRLAGLDDLVALPAGSVRAHLKVNTGMNRAGAQPEDVVQLARRVAAMSAIRCEGIFTHFACADHEDPTVTHRQLELFNQVVELVQEHVREPLLVHAANSAGAAGFAAARYDMVRWGIAAYGLSPYGTARSIDGLVSSMRVISAVSNLRIAGAGEGVSYGHRTVLQRPTLIATVPVGYGDGIRRDYGLRGGHVLVGGQRCEVLGVVTMDQMMVAVPETTELGDEVVLIGSQGEQTITADEIADVLDTIGYEVVCALSARVPRVVRPFTSSEHSEYG